MSIRCLCYTKTTGGDNQLWHGPLNSPSTASCAVGTGKTETVVAIAKRYKLNIYLMDLSMIADNSDFERLMLDARDPCLVLIDDIHRMVDFDAMDQKKDYSE